MADQIDDWCIRCFTWDRLDEEGHCAGCAGDLDDLRVEREWEEQQRLKHEHHWAPDQCMDLDRE